MSNDSYYVIQFRLNLNGENIMHRDTAGNIVRFYDYRNAKTVFHALAQMYRTVRLIRIDSDDTETEVMEVRNYE